MLEDLHTSQSLGSLKFTSADTAFVKETVKRVYPLIPATATAPDSRMVPSLGMPSPVRRGSLSRPRRRPRRRGERGWGCDASASSVTGSVRRRGSFRLGPHHGGERRLGPHHGGERRRRQPGATANSELRDVATRGPSTSKTSTLQPAPLIGQARLCMRVYSH